jgi:hypothetical protein
MIDTALVVQPSPEVWPLALGLGAVLWLLVYALERR